MTNVISGIGDKQITNTKHNKYVLGFVGIGKYSPKIDKKSYQVWKDMFKRCYDEKTHILKPYYIGCSICIEWFDFQIFTKWFYENYIEGFQLDKDLLTKDNRIYSPITCCFIPLEINVALQKYKTKKSDLPTGVCYDKTKYMMYCGVEERKRVSKSFGTIKEASDFYKETKESYIKRLAEKFKPTLSKNSYTALMNWTV